MTISLGGIALPDDDPHYGTLQWPDRWASGAVAHASVRTRGGRLVTSQVALSGGRTVTLATNGGAWLTTAQVTSLEALALASVATPVELVYRDTGLSVLFDWQQGHPLQLAETRPNSGRWVGSIRLITP